MKTSIKVIAMMTMVLLVASCKNEDAHMLTVINTDGTCSREYTFHSTQQWLAIPPEEDYDSIVDKSWERSWSVVGADSMRYPVPLTEAQLDSMQALDYGKPLGNILMVHVKKEFKCVEDMSTQLYKPEYSHLVRAEGFKATSSLDKRFKWFYTDYTFTETFAYDGPAVFPIALDRYLSADTASFWFTGQPDLTRNLSGSELKEMLDGIERKVSSWADANWFTEIYTTIADRYDEIQNPPVDKQEFVRRCDSLAMVPETFRMSDYDGQATGVGKLFDKYFHSDAYNQLLQSDTLNNEQSYQQLLTFNTSYDLVMPGRVLDAGMGEYDGKAIHYRISGLRTIPNDYKYSITATSRVTNIWAFVVAAVVILLAIGSFFFLNIEH